MLPGSFTGVTLCQRSSRAKKGSLFSSWAGNSSQQDTSHRRARTIDKCLDDFIPSQKDILRKAFDLVLPGQLRKTML